MMDGQIKNKFILNFTPTGMIPTKKMTKYVPIEPEDIVSQVIEATELGANMVHIHAREPATGQPTYKKEIYSEIISGIRKKTGISLSVFLQVGGPIRNLKSALHVLN